MRILFERELSTEAARPVKSYEEIAEIIPEFIDFVNVNNGKFKGNYSTGYAFAHPQVSKDPLQLIIIAKEWTEEHAPANMKKAELFKSQVIVNPKILSIPEKTIQKRKILDPLTQKEVVKDVPVTNQIRLKEGCMSFPHKVAKNVDRAFEVRVEYQIPVTGFFGGMKLKRVRETVKGLKAHIFQHECDHMAGRNIFYGNRVKK